MSRSQIQATWIVLSRRSLKESFYVGAALRHEPPTEADSEVFSFRLVKLDCGLGVYAVYKVAHV